MNCAHSLVYTPPFASGGKPRVTRTRVWLHRASGRRSSCAYAVCVIHCNVSLAGACSTRVHVLCLRSRRPFRIRTLMANFLARACGQRLRACKSTTAHGAAFVCTRTASHAPIAPRSRPSSPPPPPLPPPRCPSHPSLTPPPTSSTPASSTPSSTPPPTPTFPTTPPRSLRTGRLMA